MAFDTDGLTNFNSYSRETESESDEDKIPCIQDTDLTTLTRGQRIGFTVIVVVLCILSVSGNLGTLYANKRRKVRLFFRTCLVSLALSDLITTVFMTVGYLAQFGAPSVQIWSIGGVLCRFIPFVTTGAILVSSMTLVGIALDRYFAVMRVILGFWNPNKVFCVVFAIIIWGLSFGIASPVYSAYAIYQVFIESSGFERKERLELVVSEVVEMCVSEKETNAYYYIVVLAIIFVPTLVAFVWLNSIIANKLWIRRHSVGAAGHPASSPLPDAAVGSRKIGEKQMEMTETQYDHPCHCQGKNTICSSSTLTVPTTSLIAIATTTTTKPLKNNPKTSSGVVGGNSAKHISSREARHLRMFTIVLILMAVFILFRLPAWIFLIMRMYGTYTQPVFWILHFSFGFLTLTSCALNPLLYTFLAETIQYAMFVKGKLCGLRRYFGSCGVTGCCSCRQWCNASNGDKDNVKMSQNQNQNPNQNQHQKASQNDGNYDDNDGTSNVGAKSTSSKSDDDSKVYTIIPDPEGGHVTGLGYAVGGYTINPPECSWNNDK